MGLFEDVMVNAKAAVSVVGQKAGQIVDVSKLRINAADINNEISKRFEALGRVVYDSAKSEDSSGDLVKECIAVIDGLYEQLDAINDQIAVLKNRVKCKNCGFENAQEAVFCSRCGAKLVIDPPKEAQAPVEQPEEANEEPVAAAEDVEIPTPAEQPVPAPAEEAAEEPVAEEEQPKE